MSNTILYFIDGFVPKNDYEASNLLLGWGDFQVLKVIGSIGFQDGTGNPRDLSILFNRSIPIYHGWNMYSSYESKPREVYKKLEVINL